MRNTQRFQFAAVVALGVVIGAGGALLLMRVLPGESMNEAQAGGGEGGALAPGAQAAGAGERRILYWRAPMDPNYTSDGRANPPWGWTWFRSMRTRVSRTARSG